MMLTHCLCVSLALVAFAAASPMKVGQPTYSSKGFIKSFQNKGECPEKYLAESANHDMCLNNPTRSDEGVSDKEKEQILDMHNKLRAKAGHEWGAQQADILKLYWDDELSQIAQKWASRCKWGHEPDGKMREAPGRFGVGQNIANPAGKKRDWKEVMRMLYEEEVVKFTYGVTRDLGPVGHYTAIVWSNTTLIGCGIALCDEMNGGSYFYVCNYGPSGNWMDRIPTPFKTGKPGSACPNNFDEKSGLCDCQGKTCKNGGSLLVDGCKCKCQYDVAWLDAENGCEIDCSVAKDAPWGCETDAHCKEWDNWPLEYCPIKCGTCPGKKAFEDREDEDSRVGEPDAPQVEPTHRPEEEDAQKVGKDVLVQLLEELEKEFDD